MANTQIQSEQIADDAVTGSKIENAVTVATSVTSPLVDGQNFKINGGQGSDGQVLTSTGSGVAWESISSSFASLTDTTVTNADPTLTTNPSSGVGTIWVNSTSGETYVCTDATTNGNVWKNIGGGSGNIEFRLHSASVHKSGAILVLKDENSSRGTSSITISASTGDTIDNNGAYVLTGSNPAISLYSNGADWFVF